MKVLGFLVVVMFFLSCSKDETVYPDSDSSSSTQTYNASVDTTGGLWLYDMTYKGGNYSCFASRMVYYTKLDATKYIDCDSSRTDWTFEVIPISVNKQQTIALFTSDTTRSHMQTINCTLTAYKDGNVEGILKGSLSEYLYK